MAKGDRKSNREVRKPKKEAGAKAAGAPPNYMSNVLRKPLAIDPKPKGKKSSSRPSRWSTFAAHRR